MIAVRRLYISTSSLIVSSNTYTMPGMRKNMKQIRKFTGSIRMTTKKTSKERMLLFDKADK